jgi:hypothetical protein
MRDRALLPSLARHPHSPVGVTRLGALRGRNRSYPRRAPFEQNGLLMPPFSRRWSEGEPASASSKREDRRLERDIVPGISDELSFRVPAETRRAHRDGAAHGAESMRRWKHATLAVDRTAINPGSTVGRRQDYLAPGRFHQIDKAVPVVLESRGCV